MKEQTNNEANPMSSKVLGKEAKTIVSSTPGNDNLFEDKELEGYPHYPAGEDIMNPGNDMEQIELSEEKISQPASSIDKIRSTRKTESTKSSEMDDEKEIGEGNDPSLRKSPAQVDLPGDDLDIPGSELDDEAEMIGSEDEENNAYSIGGDRHNDLEENGTDEEEEII